jgi:hypothetical protein
MKYSDSLKESLKRDFIEFANIPVENLLAYYEKGSVSELNFSVLIFEKEGRPYIVTTQHSAINIPFILESILSSKNRIPSTPQVSET